MAIITLNVSILNVAIKRHRVMEWMTKQKSSICCLQETHFRPKDTCNLKVRDEQIFIMEVNVKRKQGKESYIERNRL